jgi:hypothetical protein
LSTEQKVEAIKEFAKTLTVEDLRVVTKDLAQLYLEKASEEAPHSNS